MIHKNTVRRHRIKTASLSNGARDELVDKLKELLPSVMTEDNKINIKALQRMVGKEQTIETNDIYELKFPGKSIAIHKATSDTDCELRVEAKQSKNFDATKNVVIRGDNLDALKILQKNYQNSIKAIYIDPPYNTENDEFVYDDNFKMNEKDLIKNMGLSNDTISRYHDLFGTKMHPGWLTFMYPRLKLAKDLLTSEGMVFISIDDHEHSNLKLMCDEVFGEPNFVGNIVWEGGKKNDSKFLSVATDYILVYAKNLLLLKANHTTWRFRKEGIDVIYNKVNNLKRVHGDDYIAMTKDLRDWYGAMDKKNQAWKNKHYKSIDEKGVFFPGDISWPGGGGPKYEVLHPRTGKPVKTPKRGWMFPHKRDMDKHILEDRVEFGQDETRVPQYKRYLHETEGQVMSNVIYKDRRAAKKALDSILAENVFNDPKDVNVLEDILRLTTQKSDIVLDLFAGSGTTGEAVMILNAKDGGNRKFILVQIDEKIKKKNPESHAFCIKNDFEPVISSITIERLNRAGNIIKDEHPDVDVGYKVFSLKQKPKIDLDDTQTTLGLHADRTTCDTLFNMLCATGKPLDTPIETIIADTLYKADGEVYVLKDVDLSEHTDYKINVDGWSDSITLEQYLTLRKKMLVIY